MAVGILKILRKKGVAKKILWFVSVIIIISFGFFGQAYRLSNRGRPNYAGKVFGQKISFEQFEGTLQYTQIQGLIRYGENFYKIRPYLNLEAEAWDRLILLHEAQKRRIKISDEEVVKAIKKFPFFQKNGQYDSLVYNDILRYVFKIQPREFEEQMRDDLKLKRLYELETSHITVDEEYVSQQYKEKNEKIKVSYLVFPSENYTSQVTVDENQTQDYFQNHKNEFLMPPMINAEYLSLNFPENAKSEDVATITSKTQEIYKELSINPDLTFVSQKYNLPIQTSGFFSMEQPNFKIGWSFEVLQKIFNLEQGQLTEPIQTSSGFQIIKIKEKKESYIPEFAEVQDKVKKAMALQEAKKIAQQKAQEYLGKIQEAFGSVKLANFQETARSLGLDIHQTPAFSRGQYLPEIGLSKEFQDAAFALTEQQRLNSEVVETAKGYCILYLDELVPIDQAQYEKEVEEFAKTLITDKRNEAFGDFMTSLRLKAHLEDNVSKLKKTSSPS